MCSADEMPIHRLVMFPNFVYDVNSRAETSAQKEADTAIQGSEMRKPAHLAFLAGALFAALSALQANAADYPTRAITIIVAQGAGGGTDIISRLVGQQLAEQLAVPVVIENRPGAGSISGTLAAARAAPDGYTLQTGYTGSMAVDPSLFAHLPYDPVTDFEPVSMIAKFPFVLMVSKNFPAHSVKELIALAKAEPGQINYASAGNGTGQHLSMELFKMMTNVNLTHVPYKGSAPAYPDVISGRVPVFFDGLASALGQIKGGSVRPLAVTDTKRSPLLPDVPTVEEAGVPEFTNYVWFGFWASKGTPTAVIQKLYSETQKALATPLVKEKIAASGGEILDIPRPEIELFLKGEIQKWHEVVTRAGIQVQ
jgi:tripartite-type tricarboxylate transporter receptor subunit TctC